MKDRKRPFIIALIVIAAITALAGCALHFGMHSEAATGTPSAQPALFVGMRAASGVDYVIPETKRPFTIRESLGQGIALIDYDNDGLPDLVLLGPDAVKVYHNDGNWHFTEVTQKTGIRQAGYWQGVAVGDYDNDGYPDLYVCGYGCSALYHNEQGHGFKEVTHEAGLDSLPPDKDGNADWRSSAAFIDVDQDGQLDLFVGRYCNYGPKTIQLCGKNDAERASCSPEMYTPQKGILYMNLGHGRFRDETKERGLSAASGRVIGIAAADYNDDGWIDIALANDELAGNLFENRGHGYFREVGKESGTAYDSSGGVHGGMGIDWGDYDNDGKLDLVVTTYELETKNLFHNIGGGVFTDVSSMVGLDRPTNHLVGWGTKFLDYDNDGWQDIFMTNGHVMDNVARLGRGGVFRQPLMLFHNQGNGSFTDMSNAAGPDLRTSIAGRALCVGDLDNDGKSDVVITNLDGPPLLLRNTCPTANHWVGLSLMGTRSNRMGLGSKVNIEAGNLKLVRVCTTTGSVLTANDPRILVGVGSSTLAQRITVRWPGGNVDTFTNVPVDRYYTATEGAKTLTPVSYMLARANGVQSSH